MKRQKIIYAISNRDISDDLERPLKVISVTYLLLLLCIVCATDERSVSDR